MLYIPVDFRIQTRIASKARLFRRVCMTGLIAVGFITATSNAQAAIQFVETTLQAADFDDTESWGASWGDLNDDLWPDLFVVNHRMRPSLFRNNGDGTFTNLALQVDTSRTWLSYPLADTHGGTWADFDEDGDQDLSITTGICCDGQLMINNDGVFTESAAQYGVSDDREGRLPAWLDYNGDGELDLSYMSGSSARLFENSPTLPLTNVSGIAKISNFCWRNQFAILSDIDGDDAMEYICVREGSFPMRTMDYETGVFTDSSYLPPDILAHGTDTAVADFDGDLLPDILVTRGNLMPNQVAYIPDSGGMNNKIEAWVTSGTGNGLRTITFKSTGPLTFTAHSNQVAFPWKVFRGVTGEVLPNNPGNNQAITTWTMDPADVNHHGLAYDYPGFDPDIAANRGTYVGYDPLTDLWTLTLVAGEQGSRAYYVIETSSEFTDLDLEGDAANDAPIAPALLMNTGTGFDNEVWTRGDIGQQMRCVSAGAGDFDNDMDVDIYLVCRGGVENIQNKLFENDGAGNFSEVVNAAGAAGLVGVGLDSKAGTGENVTIADYDLDGYLDLFVTNGLIMQPFGVGAQDQLFKNSGSGNHWIEIDLVGTASNIEGIGAKILVTTEAGTANEKIQLREQNGDYHRWSQHHTRKHFGLGANTAFDIEIRWPSGTVDNFTNVSADQIVEVTEGGAIVALQPGPAVGDPAPVAGDECGSPLYTAAQDTGIYLWKDCDNTDTWQFELIGGNIESSISESGTIVSSQVLSSITETSLEGQDLLDTSESQKILFSLTVANSGLDAFSFLEAVGSDTCLFVDIGTIPIYLGAKHVRSNAPLNLNDVSKPCISIQTFDISVTESTGSASVVVSLSNASADPVTLDVSTAEDSALAANDFSTTAQTLTFLAGETSKTIEIPILDDNEYEATESLNVLLTNSMGGVIVTDTATIDIQDDDAELSCGEPSYSPTGDKVVAVWKDCGTDDWHMRVTAGGQTGIRHSGTLLSSVAVSNVATFSFEGNDVLTVDPQAGFDFDMFVTDAGVDGIDFTVTDEANMCLSTDDPSIQILVGSLGMTVNPPVDLNSLTNCITADIADVSVNENSGNATVTVSLSDASTHSLTVDLSSTDGTAETSSDYDAIAQTITFPAGNVTASVQIPIIDDSVFEPDETFTLTLANGAGLFVPQPESTVTILDDDALAQCGKPNINAATEKVLAVWKDCGTNTWHLQASAGGPSVANHAGTIASTESMQNVSAVGFEANDVLNTTDPQSVTYNMLMIGNGLDGIDLETATGAALCLTTNDPSIPIKVGAAGTVVTSSVDLDTLGPCRIVTIADAAVLESDSEASVTVALTTSSTSAVTLDVSTQDGSALAGADYTSIVQTLTFAPGETTKTVAVPLLADMDFEAIEDFKINISNVMGAFVADDSATVSIEDDDGGLTCGEPTYSPNSDLVMALWKDCASGTWHMRVTAGGGGSIGHVGTLHSSEALTNIIPFSFEGNDILDTAVPNVLEFNMRVVGAGVDGINFDAPTSTELCLSTDNPSIPVIVGANGNSVTTPTNLNTLTPCANVQIQNATVDESAGSADVTVSIAEAISTDVSVDVMSSDGTAIAGSDYTSVTQSVVITAGTTSTVASFAINDDTLPEDTESFNVTLQNVVGGFIQTGSASVSIIDDDTSTSCGAPSINANVDKALFIWKDCGTDTWHMRSTAGGEIGIQHEGSVTLSNGSFPDVPAFTPFSMEGIDVVTVSNADAMTYLWRMSNNGIDGMDFTLTNGTNLCLDTLNASIPIFIGADRTSVAAPIDLETLGACQ